MKLADVDINKFIQDEIRNIINQSDYLKLLDHLKKRQQITNLIVDIIKNKLELKYQEEKTEIETSADKKNRDKSIRVLETTKRNLLEHLNSPKSPLYDQFVDVLFDTIETNLFEDLISLKRPFIGQSQDMYDEKYEWTNSLGVEACRMLKERIIKIKSFPDDKLLLEQKVAQLRKQLNDMRARKRELPGEINYLKDLNPKLYPKNKARNFSIYSGVIWGISTIKTLVLIVICTMSPVLLTLPAFLLLLAIASVAAAVYYQIQRKKLDQTIELLEIREDTIPRIITGLEQEIKKTEDEISNLENELFEKESAVVEVSASEIKSDAAMSGRGIAFFPIVSVEKIAQSSQISEVQDTIAPQ